MPATAVELGLIVNDLVDERNDFNKSTLRLQKKHYGYYPYIRKLCISSVVLTIAT
ncbi:MAG: hypothetical protein R2765_06070 [Ferruginibacter sp.]